MTDHSGKPSVAVVGGGPAGLAAAAAACQEGFRTELFEQRNALGGRAGSFLDPETGGLVDYCRHVSMGCCRSFSDFCRRTGVAACFARHPRMHFIAPDGKRSDFAAARWLPAPLHLLPGLLRLRFLTFGERLRIIRALRSLAAEDAVGHQTIGAWLRRQGQSQRVVERFWSVVLQSALGETVDRASLAAARQVFVEGFLASPDAYELQVPQIPLGEIFDRRVGAWLQQHNVAVHRGTRIRRIEGDSRRATAAVLPDGTRRRFDLFIVTVPWRHVGALFAPPMLAAMPDLQHVDNIDSAPITAVHLWFDRPITPLPHAVLVGKTSQWVFRGGESQAGHYCQVVISASRDLIGRGREQIVGRVGRELKEVFPAARAARLLHRRVVTHPAAVFSMIPGLDRFRPAQQTPVENLLLAGDWTATGWPATMEGAVRSGYNAVTVLCDRG